jgi:hypothetical protein
MAQIGVNRGCESLSGYISGIVVVRPGRMVAREAGLVVVQIGAVWRPIYRRILAETGSAARIITHVWGAEERKNRGG